MATDKLTREKEILIVSSKALQARQLVLVKSIEQVEAANGASKHLASAGTGAAIKAAKRFVLRAVNNAACNLS